MNDPLFIIEPLYSGPNMTIVLSLLASVLALGLLWYLLKNKNSIKNHDMRLLTAMLVFFVFIIGLGSAVFTKITSIKTAPVKIYSDHIETAYGSTPFSDLERIYVKEETKQSFINPNITTKKWRILMLDSYSGQKHILPEKYYDTGEIMNRLKETEGKWRKEEGRSSSGK